ncbi:Formyltransferase [Dacryopinax primogenitus]|uniref:Formyltransferase n=1 Tax=Dacryopinax primogenitus (strain DJM 731) TaxID=1858805 RepID=M5G8M2_DACPD|nr:Formyltransferase [Dacryopinax primogenitus]EJU02182.1 Formyltransferase [Dacryopinax primogenitus]
MHEEYDSSISLSSSHPGLPAREETRSSELSHLDQPSLVDDMKRRKDPLEGGDMMVVASFGRILPPELLNRFAHNRRLNVHPSLLPKLRGASPIQMAIYEGHARTGVSIIGVEEKVDAGAIWAQDPIGVYSDDTFLKLRAKLGALGGRLLVDVLRKMLINQAVSHPQGSGATYAPKITDSLSKVNWNTMTATQVSRIWRAIGHAHPPKSTFLSKNGQYKTFRMIGVQEVQNPVADLKKPGSATFVKKTAMYHVRCAEGTEIGFKIAHTEGAAMAGVKQWRNGLPKAVMRFGKSSPSETDYEPQEYDIIHPHRAGPSPFYTQAVPL